MPVRQFEGRPEARYIWLGAVPFLLLIVLVIAGLVRDQLRRSDPNALWVAGNYVGSLDLSGLDAYESDLDWGDPCLVHNYRDDSGWSPNH
jgi:hypothetical protein